MKAYNLHAVGDLRYEDLDMPCCPSGWALVEVRAAGICSSDIPRIFTKGTYHFPTVPGHEFSGVVHSVADSLSDSLVGSPVGVFPLIPCRKCASCKEHRYETCSNYDYIGSRRDGAFAEYVAVPIWNLVRLPHGISFETAAMMEPLAVALHSLKQGKLESGMNVAIVGTGMIGIAAGQWAKKLGASNVIVLGRSDAKREMVERCGLKYGVGTETDGGYDFVLEAVGTPESVDLTLELVRSGGHVVLMGNPSGEMTLSQASYWKILRKQLVVSGTWNSSYDGEEPSDWMEVRTALSDKSITTEGLITHRYDQAEFTKGLKMMREHKEPFCKVMTLWNQ